MKLLALCSAVLLWTHAAYGADKAWTEVRSEHFRVLSDGDAKEARAVARQFEQIRAAFAAALPSLNPDPPVPLLILAPKDATSAKALLPQMWKRGAPGGFFSAGREKAFALVRLDVVRDGHTVAFHEYTHSILNSNFRWLPLWLNEGLAEFFGNTRFESDRIYVGAANIRAEYTRGASLLPLEKLLKVDASSAEYQDPDKVQMFYSESWALVHMLLVPSSAERGKRLQQYLTLIDKGADAVNAFRSAIGEPADMEKQLNTYLDRKSFDVLVSNSPTEVVEETFTARALSSGEINEELGTVQVWLGENAAARKRLEQTLKDDPRSALANESMGFLHVHEGRNPQALAQFERALQLNARLYLSAYYAAMLSSKNKSTADLRGAMNQVLELNPEFAPAHIQLAASYLRDGNSQNAVTPALKAVQIRPALGGYHTALGRILHAAGRDDEAAAVARYVAERWQDLHHDEAVDLWEMLSPDARKGADFPRRPTPSGTREVRGSVTSLTCRDNRRVMDIVIDSKPHTFRVNDNQIRLGLADSVWYAPDHFNRCHHIEGLRAIIYYKQSSNSRITGDLVQFDIHRVN